MESSHRGLVHHLGKVAWGKLHREFESPTLRKNKEPGAKAFGDCIFAGEGVIRKSEPNRPVERSERATARRGREYL